ncbi:MAG TPA: D-alanyl-D-alanine carboxypeptidase, partial [Ideonella sp.]|nr:D-alanyl-D-alanine carboxypeptidase [Ideonella sp.]
MPPLPLARLIAGAVCWLAAAAGTAQGLPGAAEAALRRAKLPTSALAAVVQDAQTGERRLAWNAEMPVNPASVFKLFTTYAALDKLGPAWTWSTPVYVSGTLRDGVLDGSVAVKGSGDPKLVLERLWLLLRRLQQMGIHEIRGDIVLDNSAFTLPDISPASFDGEAHRPYNVRPDALLLNYKSLTLGFLPDPARGVATVIAEPDLAGVAIDPTVPLAPGACGDWRAGLKATLADAGVLRFAGSYPASCAEKSWPLAYADPSSYNARVLGKLWQEMGGRLGGRVRSGLAPAGQAPSFELSSPTLAEVVRDINKFSNNVMAE